MALLKVFMKDTIEDYKKKESGSSYRIFRRTGCIQKKLNPVIDWRLKRIPHGKKYIEFVRNHD
jgi:hypothetical protein